MQKFKAGGGMWGWDDLLVDAAAASFSFVLVAVVIMSQKAATTLNKSITAE